MFHDGHPHSDLLLAIERVGEVPCQRLPQVFFPEDLPDRIVRKKAIEAAKALCADCPLLITCRTYAIGTGQEWGVWGGMTADEIKAHRARP